MAKASLHLAATRRDWLRAAGGGGTAALVGSPRRARAQGEFGRAEAGHLLRRAGFGGTPAEAEALAAKGRAAAVDALVDYENTSNDALEAELDALVQDVPRGQRADRGRIDLKTFPGIKAWWVYRLAHSARPFEEKMTLFWHGHFATAISKVARVDFMLNQNHTLRRLALAPFRELVLAVSRDPAMIVWLDNNTNVKGAPNENYARELMELFTMGIDHVKTGASNYTERDVQEVARAFTGWTVRRTGFFFNRSQHDSGPKTVFGQTGNFGGEDVIDLILERDATAYFLSWKLWTFFAYESPEMEILDELAEVMRASGYDLRAVVRHLFNMDAFYSEKARFATVKSPAELVAGAARHLGLKFNDERGYNALANFMRTMDQELFNPPTVKGWDGGLDWVNTNTLLVRYNVANLITTLRPGRIGQGFEPSAYVRAGQSPEEVVTALLEQLGGLEVSAETSDLLVDYLTDGDASGFRLDPRTQEVKVRGLAHLIMSLPEYQLN